MLVSTFLSSFLFLSFAILSKSMSSSLVQNVQNALKLHQAGDVYSALPLYEHALSEKDSLNANIISTLASNVGSIYMGMGDYEKAALKFEIAIEATPEKVESHYNYAVVLNSKLKDNVKALQHCAKAMKLDPSFYKAYHLMGNIMQDLGRPDKADDYFIKAEHIATALGVDDPSLAHPSTQSGFKLDSIWMFQSPEVNKSYEIPIPVVQREKHGGRASLTVTCLSVRPLVFEIPLLLTAQECEHVKSTAAPKLELSHVMGSKINPDSGASDSDLSPEPYRSSYNAWLPLDPVLISLQERIALITTIPLQYISLKSEELQVVKYETGGQFKMHHDSSAFNPRLLTALVYLQDSSRAGASADAAFEDSAEICNDNDVNVNDDLCGDSGGETLFPLAGEEEEVGGTARSSWSVDDALLHLSKKSQHALKTEGLAVRPSLGKAIIFFNHLAGGRLDPLAVHSGSKLTSGTKWVANYWVGLDLKALNDMPAAQTSV